MIYLDTMGHLYSDESLQELYDFAVKKLYLKPQWNHYSRLFPHFDLTTSKKKSKAVKLGAIKVDARDDKEQYDRCRTWCAKFHEENEHLNYWYECKGLANQKILRIDFAKLGIR